MFTLSCCFLLCSCSAAKPPEIVTAVNESYSVTDGETEYICRLDYVNTNTASVTFLSPSTMKNMIYRRADGKYILQLGSLICKTDSPAGGERPIASWLIGSFDAISSSEPEFSGFNGSECEFKVNSKNGALTVITDPEGKIKSLKSGGVTVTKK